MWYNKEQTQFQISAQGIGIPAADQQHLFESSHRGENATATAGTGLGLAVVKKCLDIHGGAIAMDS
ncbi:MAG: sensor histidine kinase [Cyanobacteria bacterium P01_H01_bin.15]